MTHLSQGTRAPNGQIERGVCSDEVECGADAMSVSEVFDSFKDVRFLAVECVRGAHLASELKLLFRHIDYHDGAPRQQLKEFETEQSRCIAKPAIDRRRIMLAVHVSETQINLPRSRDRLLSSCIDDRTDVSLCVSDSDLKLAAIGTLTEVFESHQQRAIRGHSNRRRGIVGVMSEELRQEHLGPRANVEGF